MTALSGLALGLFGASLPLSVAGANIAWGILVAALLWDRPSLRNVKSPLQGPLLASFAVWALSAAMGIDPGASFLSWNREAHKIWIAGLLGLGLGAGGDPLPGLALGFTVSSLVGIMQAVMHGPAQRAHAFVHPVVFGEQSAIAAIGAVCFWLRGQQPRSRRVAGWIAVLAGLATVLSQTRTAIISAVAGILAVIWIGSSRQLRAWLAPAAMAATLGVVCLLGILRYGRIEGGAPERGILWGAAVEMAMDSPWTGVGPGNFRAAFSARHAPMEQAGNAHNLYLHHLAERGVLGLSVTLWLMAVLILCPMRRAREHPTPWNLWAFGAGTAFAIMNVAEVALQTEVVWMLVWLVWLSAERSPDGEKR